MTWACSPQAAAAASKTAREALREALTLLPEGGEGTLVEFLSSHRQETTGWAGVWGYLTRPLPPIPVPTSSW